MKNNKELTSFGEKIAERNARRNGHGAIISIPAECIGRRYARYIDRSTGMITLVPIEARPAYPREEEAA